MESIDRLRDFDYFSEKVIIRAVGDEPVCLTAVSMREGAINVVGADGSQEVAFHAHRAFRYDEVTYRRLREAYERGESMDEAWQEVEQFTPPELTSPESAG